MEWVFRRKTEPLFSRFMQINFRQMEPEWTFVGKWIYKPTIISKVEFKENEGGGSVFIVELPLNKDVYESDDFVNEQINPVRKKRKKCCTSVRICRTKRQWCTSQSLPIAPLAGKKFKILVIDENRRHSWFSVRKIVFAFRSYYCRKRKCRYQKRNGRRSGYYYLWCNDAGHERFDLTKKLKDDFATCHIPVILYY